MNFIDDAPAAISNPFASTLATSRATRGAANVKILLVTAIVLELVDAEVRVACVIEDV